MASVLYFSRNPNPRLAVAVARYLQSDVVCEFASPFDPQHSERFRQLNPSLLLPILVENGHALWEADAIACRLSLRAGSRFWRMDQALPEMIRWISWGKDTFVRACDAVHFERGTKQRYGLGPIDHAALASGHQQFVQAATQLNEHLERREFLLDCGLSYADFRMACFLPFNDVAQLPLADFPAISAWNLRLAAISAWADPFAGLEAPALPAIAV